MMVEKEFSGGVWYPLLRQQGFFLFVCFFLILFFFRSVSYLMLQQLCCSFDSGKDHVAID